jgi:hypothetical protein
LKENDNFSFCEQCHITGTNFSKPCMACEKTDYLFADPEKEGHFYCVSCMLLVKSGIEFSDQHELKTSQQ